MLTPTDPQPAVQLPAPPRGLPMPLAFAFYGVLLLLAVGWAALTEPGLQLLTRTPVSRQVPWWAAGLGVGLALVTLTAVIEARSVAMRRVAAELAVLVLPVTWPRVIAMALLSGVCEEALFRGAMQHTLGYALTSLAFALLHGGVKVRYLPWSGFALLAALVFGLLAVEYQSPWPPALAHVVVNAVNLRRLLHYAPTAPGQDPYLNAGAER